MREDKVRVVNNLGLHARAAARLVRVATAFNSRILLTNPVNNLSADAKSILSILTLSASTDTVLFLKVEGEDEISAFDAVNALFETGFGEF